MASQQEQNSSVSPVTKEELARNSMQGWLDVHNIKNEKGDPITFHKHLFLKAIYEDQSDNLVVMKPAQVGMSTLEVLKNIRDAESHQMDVIYTLPTDADVRVFVAGKVNRIIANNPHLLALTANKDSIEQKDIGMSTIYFRGCFDDETEVLTTNGFKKRQEIAIGDKLPTLNITSGKLEVQEVLDKSEYEVNEELVSVESRAISSLLTIDHRCVVSKRGGGAKIARAYQLTKNSLIPLIWGGLGEQKQDDFSELLGWVISDGSYWTETSKTKYVRKDGTKNRDLKYNRVVIVQKKYATEVRELLTKSFTGWYEKRVGTCPRFELSRKDAKRIREICPNKELTFELINALPQSSLHSLFHGLMMGDGNGKKYTQFYQSTDTSAFQYLCTLLGRSTVNHTRYFKEGAKRFSLSPLNTVSIKTAKNATKFTITKKRYTGTVWCPTTANGTVFVRRNGKVYPTGQTWTAKAAIMIACDRLVHDEKDSSKQEVIADFQARLQHSKFKQTHVFSHPSAMNSGVDLEWRMSDQKEWFITCPHCQKEQYMSWNTEDSTRMSVDLIRKEFVCKKCHGILHWKDRAFGVWKGRKALRGAKWSGYHISLLMAPWVTAGEIVAKYNECLEGKQTMDYFYNKLLGLPYAGGGNSVDMETILGSYTERKNMYTSRLVIGVDTGIKLRYVYGNKEGLTGFGEMTDYMPDEVNKLPLEQTLEYFLVKFDNSIMVIDQGGDIIGSRKLRAKYPGRVFLCFYARDRKTMQLIRWGEKDESGNVTVDRNRTIQLVIGLFKERRIPLFGKSREEWYDYWLHWSHIFRTVEEDTLGVLQYVWHRSDRDDWIHATCYWYVGISRFGSQGALVGLSNEPEPNSYELNPDNTVSFDPASLLDRKVISEEPWWGKEEDGGEWRG